MQKIYTFTGRDSSSDIGSFTVLIATPDKRSAKKLMGEHLVEMNRLGLPVNNPESRPVPETGIIYSDTQSR